MNGCLYRMYGQNGELLYVGASMNFFKRYDEHRRNTKWFGEISWMKLDHFSDRIKLRDAEREMIKNFAPKYNIQHNPKNQIGSLTCPK